ncbi:PEPxxWA-CTERM sorting domain-containing protein [Sandarakinorhabdus oryzae]|uniref:PEPxxWA-CTERM sorting domain-containing protein n=1 Tax=Sandarakinorhabdus oryzae TaxID=2675220 RepID=UPI001F4397FB|nr:PEPxxWA-CTERM sorting domain-containing protein [Sandarakinorhabdus oryzae]
MTLFRNFAGAAIAAAILASPALAVDSGSVTFAQFTQQTSNKIAQYNAIAGGNSLTILESPVYFVVSAFGPIGFYPSTMTMSASSNAMVTSLGPQFQQLGWTGNIHFGNGANYLDVNFTNATFSFDGAGGSASMISTDPSNPISYTSNLLTLPDFDFRNFSLAFTGLTPAFTVAANGYGTPFNANVAGSFAGSVGEGPTGGVPEPSSWAMMLAGFGMVGFTARRRATMATVAS